MLARDRGFCTPTRGFASITVVLSTLAGTALVCAATAASAAGSVFSEQSCLQGVKPTAANCTFDAGLGAPISLAVSPDGKFLYVGGEAGNGSARLQVFGPDGSGGFKRIQCITSDPTDPATNPKCDVQSNLDGPTDLEVTADGKNLYAGSHNGVLFVFSRATSGPNVGHVAALPGKAGCVAGVGEAVSSNCTVARRTVAEGIDSSWVAFSPDKQDQQLIYTGGERENGVAISVFQRDASTGALSQPVTGNGDARWCVTDTGDAQAWDANGNPTGTGACTLGADPNNTDTLLVNTYSLAFNAAGTRAYASNPGGAFQGTGAAVFEFSRTPGAPAVTPLRSGTVGPVELLGESSDVVVSPTTGDVYVSYPPSPNFPANSGAVAAFSPTLGVIGCISESGASPCIKGHGLTGANALTLSPDGTHLYVAGQLGASIAELTVGANGGLSQPPSGGKEDCAASGGADNCIAVGGLQQASTGAFWDFTDSLAVGPTCAGPALYNAAFDDSALHAFSLPTAGGGRTFTLTLGPQSATNPVGTKHKVTATLSDGCGPVSGQTIRFTVTGANPTSGTGTTDSTGKATFEYTGTHTGQDTIVACYDADKNGTCGGSGDATSNQATKTWTASADLSVTKTDSPDPVFVGQTLTYKLTAKNGGPSNATGVKVTDNLPAGVSFQSATPSQGSCSQSAGTVTCNLGNLASGASATVEIKVTPQSAGSITNNATVGGNEPDPNSSNNRASAQTTVSPSADLSITKTDSPDPVVVGQTLTYKLAVKNGGPSPATGVTVIDNLPLGVTFQSATPSQGSCSQFAGTVACNLGSLASGASATVEIAVTPQLTGTITNTATVRGNESDSNTANNQASAQTTVNGCGTGTTEPDRNGDLHSNCHTGSKFRGAGGNDKPGTP